MNSLLLTGKYAEESHMSTLLLTGTAIAFISSHLLLVSLTLPSAHTNLILFIPQLLSYICTDEKEKTFQTGVKARIQKSWLEKEKKQLTQRNLC